MSVDVEGQDDIRMENEPEACCLPIIENYLLRDVLLFQGE
jgi:hypothetical protein